MAKIKEQKGITLVALIITIIVLLILAMVSIRLVMNEGVINRANRGTQTYTAEEVQEQMKLAYSEWEVAQWDGTAGDATVFVRTRLSQTYGANLDQSSVKVEDGKVTAKINGKIFEYNSSTGKSVEKKPGLGDIVTKDNYGDYIDLGQDVLGDSNTANDWRILYNDKNNTYGGTDGARVYAILADYLPNTNDAVSSAGFTSSEKYGTYNVYSSTSRQDFINKLENEAAWKTLVSTALQNKGAKVRGATTVEIIMASYNEKYGTNLEYADLPYLYIDADSSKGVDTLYMPHPGNGYNECYGYWLASIVTSYNYGVWDVYSIGGRVDYLDYDGYRGSRSVCPVVSLPSNLQVSKNGNVWTVVQ